MSDVQASEKEFFFGRLKNGSPHFISERVGGLVVSKTDTTLVLKSMIRAVENTRVLTQAEISSQVEAGVMNVKANNPTLGKKEENALRQQLAEQIKNNAFGIVTENIPEPMFTEATYSFSDFNGVTFMKESENPKFFKDLEEQEARKRAQAAGLHLANNTPRLNN